MWSFYWLDVNSGASSKIASKSSEVINDNAAFLIRAAGRPLHRRYDSATSKIFEVINWSGIIMWSKKLSYQYKPSVNASTIKRVVHEGITRLNSHQTQ